MIELAEGGGLNVAHDSNLTQNLVLLCAVGTNVKLAEITRPRSVPGRRRFSAAQSERGYRVSLLRQESRKDPLNIQHGVRSTDSPLITVELGNPHYSHFAPLDCVSEAMELAVTGC
jgi:hypothetical protein